MSRQAQAQVKVRRPSRWWLNPVVWISLSQVTWIVVLVLWILYVVDRNERLAAVAAAVREEGFSLSEEWATLTWGVVLLVVLFVTMVFIAVALTRYWSENRAIHSFVSTVSHELRTPLASINLYLETLQAHADLSAEQRDEFVSSMLAEVDRLSASIDAILEASRVERRGFRIALEPVSLGAFVRAYHRDRAPQVAQRRRSLGLGLVDDLVVMANPDALKSILNNLVENAVRYSEANGQVTLSVQRERGRARLEVRDDGRGIDARDLRRVFKMFYRGHGAGGVKGTGLGLYIVQRLIRAMGGEVQVASGGKGRGTEVSVSLPLAPPQGA